MHNLQRKSLKLLRLLYYTKKYILMYLMCRGLLSRIRWEDLLFMWR